MPDASRKKTFIDPHVQGALVRRLIVHWFGFLGVAAAIAFCLQLLSDPFRPPGEHLQQAWYTHGPFLVVMLFMLPIFVIDSIKLSHRFTGPIYRVRQTVRALANGEEYKPMKFRDFDFWQGLAVDFNKMIERLSAANPDVQLDPPIVDDDESDVPAVVGSNS